MQLHIRKLLIVLLLFALTLGGIVSTRVAASGDTAAQRDTIPSGPVVVRLYYTDRPNIDYLARELDIWEVHKKESYVITRVRPDQYISLTRQGYRLEIDVEETNKLNAPMAALDPRFYFFDNNVPNANGRYIVNFLQDTNAAYPTLTELFDVGDAWQASHGGYHRDMWVLRITNEDSAFGPISSKPPFFLFANVHAREVATPEMGIRYIKYLLTGYNGEGGYNVDADATWLVDNNVVYIMLVANPDGRIPDEIDIDNYRRKNMDNDDGCSDPSSWGVDLNRNSSFLWGCCGGSSGSACSDTYRGPARGSEPETQAFQNYIASVLPDQNGPNGDTTIAPASPITTTGVFLSLHSYSDVILWPWDLPGYSAPPNLAQLQAIGRKLGYFTGYSPDGGIGYTVDGSTDQWAYGKLGVASFTFEIGSQSGTCGDFFPAYGCMDGIDGTGRSFWAENKPAFLYLHKIADTPYRTAYGPDTEDLFSIPGVAEPGENVLLAATVSDHRYGSDPLQPVNAAEYFIGGPGLDGTGTAMSPSDGSWGETSEEVQVTFDTTGLTPGKHLVLIHGRNSSGQWGPFTAMFLYVAEPGVAPVIEGYVRDAGTNAPLAATLTAGPFQATTDPATGFYSMMVISGTYTVQASAPDHSPASMANVAAQDYQLVQQNFYLDAVCTVFSDNVESGAGGWTAQTPWAITTEASHSTSHSWTESPGGDYGNGRATSLTSQSFNLTGYTGVALSFWHIYDTEPSWDYAYVEYSTNGGSTWTQAVRYHGYDHTAWTQEVLSLPALNNVSNARIRFRFTSDSNTTADGWHIDDIQLTSGGAGCATPMAPSADFTTHGPVWLGEVMRFTDLTMGTPPLQHAWNFGDGQTSTLGDPQHLYGAAGEYLVTLTVTNTLGSDTVTHTVTVSPVLCSPFTSLDLSRMPTGIVMPGETVAFSADFLPNYAAKPYTYTISYGGAPVTGSSSADPLTWNYAFPAVGDYDVTLAAWNCYPTQTVTATLPITVANFGVAAFPESDAAQGDPGALVTYTLRVTNTGDLQDTLAITLSGEDWATNAPASLDLAPLAGEDVAVVVHIPVSAAAGDSDEVAVVIASAHPAAEPVTVTLTTTAEAVYDLAVAADVTAQIVSAPGEVVTYTLTVTNTGNATDTFTVTVDSDWPVSYASAVGPLAAGAHAEVWVVVEAPAGALNGMMDTAVVTVTSQGNPWRKETLALRTSLPGSRLYLPVVHK